MHLREIKELKETSATAVYGLQLYKFGKILKRSECLNNNNSSLSFRYLEDGSQEQITKWLRKLDLFQHREINLKEK